MSLIQEVGINRAMKYIFFTLWQVVFNSLLFSPLRIIWLKLAGATVGSDCFIDAIDFFNLDRTGLTGLVIGNRVFLGRGVLIDTAGKITIENWVTIAPRAIILSHLSVGFDGHPLLPKYPKTVGHTTIKSGSFVGVNAVITHNVTVGDEAIIGAGTVVTKNVPAHTKYL